MTFDEAEFAAEVFPLLQQGLLVYAGIRDELLRLLKNAKERDPDYANFAQSQLYFFGERSQSINVLLQHGKLWDCEILMRSALECATRFLFVSVVDYKERRRRIGEYWVDLHEIDVLQQSLKSGPAAKAARGSRHEQLLEGVVLSPEERDRLQAKWPRAKRASLQQKWSFSEMVRELVAVHREGLDLRLYDCFLHGYSLSSHMIHADQTAVSLVWDRNNREAAERNAMIIAHAARLVTDQVDLLFLCWRAFAHATGIESRRFDLQTALQNLHEAAEPYHEVFALSQEDFYRKWKRV